MTTGKTGNEKDPKNFAEWNSSKLFYSDCIV